MRQAVWNDRVLESPFCWVEHHCKKKGKSHCKYETTRRTALPDAPGNASGFPCKFTLCHVVAIDHAQELSHEDQEWLTIGYATAKSVKRLPDSCGAHATYATQKCCRSLASTKYISVLHVPTDGALVVVIILHNFTTFADVMRVAISLQDHCRQHWRTWDAWIRTNKICALPRRSLFASSSRSACPG